MENDGGFMLLVEDVVSVSETLPTWKRRFYVHLQSMHGFDLDHVARLAESSGEAGVHVEAASGEFARIALWGELPVGWAGRLAAGLADAGVDIRRGGAKSSDARQWLAEFEVTQHGSLDLAALDYVGLCRDEAVPRSKEELKLYHFDLARTEDGSALELTLRAPDQLGFLGNLLGHLAFFSLFQESMNVATVNGVALDVFSLRALGGAVPSQNIEQVVLSSLSRCSSSPPRRSSTPPPYTPGRRPK
jgi:hypothetical protein